MTRSSRTSELVAWGVAGLLAAGALVWAAPRFLPFAPEPWTISRHEAREIALERLRSLGEPIESAYVVERVRGDQSLERRLQLLASGASRSGDGVSSTSAPPEPAIDLDRLAASEVARRVLVWEVTTFAPGAQADEWSERVELGLDGEILRLERRELGPGPGPGPGPEREGPFTFSPPLSDADAVATARAHLEAQGRASLLGPSIGPSPQPGPAPTPRDECGHRRGPGPIVERERTALGERVTVRFHADPADLRPTMHRSGVEVVLEHGVPRGFRPWLDDPRLSETERDVGRLQVSSFLRVSVGVLLLPWVAVPFLRRYHEGLLGVRRGVQIFLACSACGAVSLLLLGEIASAGSSLGFIGREQTTLLIMIFAFLFQAGPLALMALMAWATGESYARVVRPQKLASLDALFGLRWASATVARSTLLGLSAGLVSSAVLVVGSLVARPLGLWPLASSIVPGNVDAAWPAVAILCGLVALMLPLLLMIFLFLPAWTAHRLRRRPVWAKAAAVLVTYVSLVGLGPYLIALPLGGAWALWALAAVPPVVAVVRGDLLSGLLATLVVYAAPATIVMLGSDDVGLQIQGWLVALVLSSPFLLSVRWLGSDREVRYTWDDVPPHVRRIADRERQRVELETARQIQSSILPDVPPRLGGVELAHSYVPATEVGGDFYDVLSLDDGRIAVAVGDVAGHGVSSGLVMSMARSALAVQATFDPDIEPVFQTLNRVVFRSARRRLLSTLVYALLDPASGTLRWASAGHVYPYRLALDGTVESLESIAYPLGVRDPLQVTVRSRRLEPGDTVVFYTDGLVEARAEGSDDLYGFGRLEAALRRHAGTPPSTVRDAILAEVDAFTRGAAPDDDVTLLLVHLPVDAASGD